jgi:hypothetical protein
MDLGGTLAVRAAFPRRGCNLLPCLVHKIISDKAALGTFAQRAFVPRPFRREQIVLLNVAAQPRDRALLYTDEMFSLYAGLHSARLRKNVPNNRRWRAVLKSAGTDC